MTTTDHTHKRIAMPPKNIGIANERRMTIKATFLPKAQEGKRWHGDVVEARRTLPNAEGVVDVVFVVKYRQVER